MHFHDVIGQEGAKQQIHRQLAERRMPHALLLAGPEGAGKLPLALALAERLLCTQPTPEGDACGTCTGCRMAAKLAHPDLHFVFPVFKPAGQAAMAVSEQFLTEWREQVADTPYFTLQTWLRRIGVENQQALINVSEANRLIERLSIVSSQGGHRVVVIWLAELMNQDCANKLLKLLEEPPAGTVFILTANRPERMLATILSRTQRIDLPPIPAETLAEALQSRNGLTPDDALPVARAAAGSYTRAIEQVTASADESQFFDLFVLFMRLCYQRKVRDLHNWAQQLSTWGRERQKAFLEYCQRLVRENFIYNFHDPALNYMNRTESDFARNFARFINERNVIGIMDELSAAARDIEQNVNPRMVFFDFALKMIVLLIQ